MISFGVAELLRYNCRQSWECHLKKILGRASIVSTPPPCASAASLMGTEVVGLLRAKSSNL
jgi:hypothetical protein